MDSPVVSHFWCVVGAEGGSRGLRSLTWRTPNAPGLRMLPQCPVGGSLPHPGTWTCTNRPRTRGRGSTVSCAQHVKLAGTGRDPRGRRPHGRHAFDHCAHVRILKLLLDATGRLLDVQRHEARDAPSLPRKKAAGDRVRARLADPTRLPNEVLVLAQYLERVFHRHVLVFVLHRPVRHSAIHVARQAVRGAQGGSQCDVQGSPGR